MCSTCTCTLGRQGRPQVFTFSCLTILVPATVLPVVQVLHHVYTFAFFDVPASGNDETAVVTKKEKVIGFSGMSGQHHIVENVEVLNLTQSSQSSLLKHEAVLFDLEAKKIAATINAPTLPPQVRSALRQMGLPVRLFGENLANVRDRLRLELARQKVGVEIAGQESKQWDGSVDEHDIGGKEDDEEVTKYTRALPALITSRQDFARFSLERAAARLDRERKLRLAAIIKKRSSAQISKEIDGFDAKNVSFERSMLLQLDEKCAKSFKAIRRITLEGSQYGDNRALSCICHTNVNSDLPLVVTGSWTGGIHLWDGSSPALSKLGQQMMCHTDRIMGIAIQSLQNDSAMIATASIDLSAKLWNVKRGDVVMDANPCDELNENDNQNEDSTSWSVSEQCHLKGHTKRLCRVAFHPMKRHLATTSFDYSWRLWDIETSQASGVVQSQHQELLLQDGHCCEVYGIGFHPDGSLCATTDFAGVVQLWDLRTGKSIRHFLGHARRVLNAEFHPINGFQLATAGDDGTIRIWDLRRRMQLASIPAHSNLITGLRFDSVSGEFLASSSFDGTVKLWNTRDWTMLNQLEGHEGKIAGVDVLDRNTLVTCGFDKTLKMWR